MQTAARECLKNGSRDPIENSAESNESPKRGRKFLLSSGGAALAFESSEEVLYMVTLPIVAAVKRPVFPCVWLRSPTQRQFAY
jgi:hypothetical protein